MLSSASKVVVIKTLSRLQLFHLLQFYVCSIMQLLAVVKERSLLHAVSLCFLCSFFRFPIGVEAQGYSLRFKRVFSVGRSGLLC